MWSVAGLPGPRPGPGRPAARPGRPRAGPEEGKNKGPGRAVARGGVGPARAARAGPRPFKSHKNDSIFINF